MPTVFSERDLVLVLVVLVVALVFLFLSRRRSPAKVPEPTARDQLPAELVRIWDAICARFGREPESRDEFDRAFRGWLRGRLAAGTLPPLNQLGAWLELRELHFGRPSPEVTRLERGARLLLRLRAPLGEEFATEAYVLACDERTLQVAFVERDLIVPSIPGGLTVQLEREWNGDQQVAMTRVRGRHAGRRSAQLLLAVPHQWRRTRAAVTWHELRRSTVLELSERRGEDEIHSDRKPLIQAELFAVAPRALLIRHLDGDLHDDELVRVAASDGRGRWRVLARWGERDGAILVARDSRSDATDRDAVMTTGASS